MGNRLLVGSALSLLFLLPLLAKGQDRFVLGSSHLHWTSTGIALTESELSAVNYANSNQLSVVYMRKSGSTVTVVGGFVVKGGVLREENLTPVAGVVSGAELVYKIENRFIYGVPHAQSQTLKSYRIDRVEVEVWRGGAVVPEGRITLSGVMSLTGKHQFLTSAQTNGSENNLELLTIPDGSGDVHFVTRCYISERKGPFRVRLKDLGTASEPRPKWFRAVDGSFTISPTLLVGNVDPSTPDTYTLFEGTVVGYKVKDAQGVGKEGRPYRLTDPPEPQSMDPALSLIENTLEEYRTWLVTESAEFRVASFTQHTVSYESSPGAGVTLSAYRQNNSIAYTEEVPSGGSMYEGLQLLVRVTLGNSCQQLVDPLLRVKGPKAKEYTLMDRGGGVYEALVLVEDDITGLEVSVSTKRYTVSYNMAAGPHVTIDWVRIGGEEGTVVASGGEVHCGEVIYVRFQVEGGFQIKSGSAEAQVNGVWEKLNPVNEAHGLYALPSAKLVGNVSAIRCEGENRPPRLLTIRYNAGEPIGFVTVYKGSTVIPDGGSVLEGEKVRVSIGGLKGNVRPTRVTVYYKDASVPAYTHEAFGEPQANEVSFTLESFADDVREIDAEYTVHTVLNESPEELEVVLQDGHVVDGSGIDQMLSQGSVLESGVRVAKGSKLEVRSKGGVFPEDSFVTLVGGKPGTVDCGVLPGTFEVVGEARVSLTLGREFVGVEYELGVEGNFKVSAHEGVRVKKGTGLPSEDLGAGEVVVSGWRVAMDSKLVLEEVGTVEGKKLLSYTVTMGGVEVRQKAGVPFAVSGAITKIVANYVRAYAVRYQREGMGYSLLEVHTAGGEVVSDGDLVAEGETLRARVTALASYVCTAINVNDASLPYDGESGVVFRVEKETRLIPQMKQILKFSLSWSAVEGVDMEVRLGSSLGEVVAAGEVKTDLPEGTLVCVRASRENHVYQGLKVEGSVPADMQDAGYWYTFPLRSNVTSIEAQWEAVQEPGAGQTRVRYVYQFANVKVHRMVNGLPAAVPNNSLVPQGTELIISIRDVAEGYRFTCIIANDVVKVVEDTYDGVYRLNVETVAHYNIQIVVEKPYEKEPRYIMVRKDDVGRVPHGQFVVYATRDGESRALTPGERYEIVPTDRYSVKVEADPGYEVAQTVFGVPGSGVVLREDGEIAFDPTAAPRSLYLLWATFRPVPTKYALTWTIEGEGHMEVYDVWGGPVSQGAELPDHSEVLVEARAGEGYKFVQFMANGLSMADANELASGKVSKRLSVISATKIHAVFAQKLVPPPPLPKPDTVWTAVDEAFSAVRLYPLPLMDGLHVENALGGARCMLYDVSGRKLSEVHIDAAGTAWLDVRRLSGGVYVLLVEGRDGARRAFRLVK